MYMYMYLLCDFTFLHNLHYISFFQSVFHSFYICFVLFLLFSFLSGNDFKAY